MRLAILGGSFNPVHIGHLLLADAVLSEAGYDRVILVPAFQSPFKAGAAGPSPKDRLEMLAASITGDPRLTVDTCELKREGVSFTIDTLVDIIARYHPDGKPGLVLGDDLAAAFHKWRRPDEIAEKADFIIARREGGAALENFPYPFRLLDNEIVNVSSSQIRERIAGRGAWRYFLPQGARSLVEGRKLYGFSAPVGGERSAGGNTPAGGGTDNRGMGGGAAHSGETRNGAPGNTGAAGSAGEAGGAICGAKTERRRGSLAETITRVENDIRAGQSLDRFLHSRNTALLAWDLCGRFGLDPRKGYLAGIAHDMCKGVKEDELIRVAHADGGSISKLEQKKPDLLHARAAAVLLSRKYGVHDKDILDAIRYHTTGNWNMGPLAKIMYVADKIEISRTKIDPALRKMAAAADLESLFSEVLNSTVSYLKSRQLDISYGTRRLLAAMHKRNKQGYES